MRDRTAQRGDGRIGFIISLALLGIGFFVGVKIIPGLPGGDEELLPGIALRVLPPFKLLEQVVVTAIVGNDQTYLERPCVRRRTMFVDTSAVGIVEFDASAEQRAVVTANGIAEAERFLATWDWDAYRRECRPGDDKAPVRVR